MVDVAGIDGAPLVVSIVSSADRLSPGEADALGDAVVGLAENLKRRAPHTRVVYLCALDAPACLAASGALARSGFEVWAPALALGDAPGAAADGVRALPDAFCADAVEAREVTDRATPLCRYAHVMVDIAGAETPSPCLRDDVLAAWRRRDFRYGDDDPDNEQLALLDAPHGGVVVRVDLDAARAGARRSRGLPKGLVRIDWRGRRRDERAAMAALRRYERFNRVLAGVAADVAEKRAEGLLPRSALAQAGWAGDASDEGLFGARRVFGRASHVSRSAKDALDRFHYLFALSPTLAVLGYEWTRSWHGASSPAPLFIYLAPFAALFVVAGVLAARHIQARYVDYRLTAELLRAQLHWRIAGVSARLETTLRLWAADDAPLLEAVARALDFQMAAAAPADRSDIALVVRNWIEGQGAWHKDNADRHKRRARWLEGAQSFVFLVAFALAAALLWLSFARAGGAQTQMLEAMAISGLPAFAGALAMIRERFSHQTFAESSTRMHRIARAALRGLQAHAQDRERQARLMEQFGRETIRESVEWMLTTRRARRIEAPRF